MRALFVSLLALLFLALPSPPGFSQSDDLKSLRNEIDALKEEQRALRKELQELVTSLRERGGPTNRDLRDLTIGRRQSPSQGSGTVLLTLVDFSGYQWPLLAPYASGNSPLIL